MDAMHDTFVRLLRHAPRLKSDALSSLLWRIATNVCLNQLRSSKRRPETASEELLLRIAAWDDTEHRALGRSMLARIFASEPASSKTIAVLHLLDGMTLEEVALEVGLSVSGVRKRLRKVKARAKAVDSGEGYESS